MVATFFPRIATRASGAKAQKGLGLAAARLEVVPSPPVERLLLPAGFFYAASEQAGVPGPQSISNTNHRKKELHLAVRAKSQRPIAKSARPEASS